MAIVSASARKVAPSLRHDPKPRHVDGSAMGTLLENTVAGRKYAWANPLDRYTGLNKYLGMGYRVETATSGGVCLKSRAVTCKPGEEIKYMDYILVSCDAETAERIQNEGEDGHRGWNQALAIEARVLDKRGSEHLQGSGLTSRHVQIENETRDGVME